MTHPLLVWLLLSVLSFRPIARGIRGDILVDGWVSALTILGLSVLAALIFGPIVLVIVLLRRAVDAVVTPGQFFRFVVGENDVERKRRWRREQERRDESLRTFEESAGVTP